MTIGHVAQQCIVGHTDIGKLIDPLPAHLRPAMKRAARVASRRLVAVLIAAKFGDFSSSLMSARSPGALNAASLNPL